MPLSHWLLPPFSPSLPCPLSFPHAIVLHGSVSTCTRARLAVIRISTTPSKEQDIVRPKNPLIVR